MGCLLTTLMFLIIMAFCCCVWNIGINLKKGSFISFQPNSEEKLVIKCYWDIISKQTLFTVKNPLLQLVKIYRMILVYLSLTGKTVLLWMLTFVSWFNHGRVFYKFKPLNIRIKMIFFELLLQWKLSFIRLYTQVI